MYLFGVYRSRYMMFYIFYVLFEFQFVISVFPSLKRKYLIFLSQNSAVYFNSLAVRMKSISFELYRHFRTCHGISGPCAYVPHRRIKLFEAVFVVDRQQRT